MDSLKKTEVGSKELLSLAAIAVGMLLGGCVVFPRIEESAFTYRIIQTRIESQTVWIAEGNYGPAMYSMYGSENGLDSLMALGLVGRSYRRKVEVCVAQMTKNGKKFLEIELPCTKEFSVLSSGATYCLRQSDRIREVVIIKPQKI